jgi:hypothetical protein
MAGQLSESRPASVPTAICVQPTLVAAKHGLRDLVIARIGAGGQAMTVERMLNVPGFAAGMSGFELGCGSSWVPGRW